MTQPIDTQPGSPGAQTPAFEVLNETGHSPIVLLCEHASNFIPAEYRGLGLPESELSRHIAWDIGAANVARTLSRTLGAVAFLGTYSRLLIDLNRPLQAPSSIVVRSEATDVPGNQGITAVERERRTQAFFKPFHDRVVEHLDERQRAGRHTVMVAIHSFTPVYHGERRPWHAGVLFDAAATLAESIIKSLRTDTSLVVGANVPYSVSPEEDYGLLVYGDHRGNPSVLIEIRQDLIQTPEGVADWAHRLQRALQLPI